MEPQARRETLRGTGPGRPEVRALAHGSHQNPAQSRSPDRNVSKIPARDTTSVARRIHCSRSTTFLDVACTVAIGLRRESSGLRVSDVPRGKGLLGIHGASVTTFYKTLRMGSFSNAVRTLVRDRKIPVPRNFREQAVLRQTRSSGRQRCQIRSPIRTRYVHRLHFANQLEVRCIRSYACDTRGPARRIPRSLRAGSKRPLFRTQCRSTTAQGSSKIHSRNSSLPPPPPPGGRRRARESNPTPDANVQARKTKSISTCSHHPSEKKHTE